MPRTAALASLPQPSSLFRGPLARPWGIMRTGRLRHTVAELSGISLVRLSDEHQVQHISLLAMCSLGVGDLQTATTTGARLRPLITAAGTTGSLISLVFGELAAAGGDHGEARDHYLLAGSSPHAEDPDLPPWRAGAAVSLVRTGDRTAAVRLAHELLDRAQQVTGTHPLALALRVLAATDASVDPVRTLWRARGLADHSNDLRLLAQVNADLATHLLLSHPDKTAEAVHLLREAESVASVEGLWPLHARVVHVLGVAGEQPRPLGSSSLAVLTDAEKRVARLASQGLTNREIAQQLTVTIKGVEWHLSRVYRKLGIDSRRGLGRLTQADTQRSRSESA